MQRQEDPAAVVQKQLDAYNARDIQALMECYAHDAQQFEYPAKLLASGAEQIRNRHIERFKETNLYAHLQHRFVLGNTVVDHEKVTRTFADGVGHIELIAIYQVVEGRISSARFISGPRELDCGEKNAR